MQRYNIGDEGAKAIANFLKNNKTLKYLDLVYNKINDEGVKFILSALKRNKNNVLTYFSLQGNKISNKALFKIDNYFRKRKNK